MTNANTGARLGAGRLETTLATNHTFLLMSLLIFALGIEARGDRPRRLWDSDAERHRAGDSFMRHPSR